VVLGTVIIAVVSFWEAVKKIFDSIRHNRAEAARKRLVRMSVNFDAKDFVQSIKAKDLHLVKLFLAAKMNPNVRYDCDTTALMHAVLCGDKAIIKALLKAGADVDDSISGGFEAGTTALDYAIGDEKTLKLLLKEHPNSETKNKAFVTAARRLNMDSMQIFLGKGGKDATLKEAGTKALIDAAGHWHRYNGKRERDRVLRFLLDSGVDPNVTDGEWTPLLRAACYGNKLAVQLLLDNGANINAICHQTDIRAGCTSLIVAIQDDHYEIAQFLLERNADVSIRNDSGATALIVASEKRSSRSAVLPIIEILLDKGAAVDAQDHQGYTALMNAAWHGWGELVHVLLERGVAVDKKDEKGRTALHFASNNADVGIVLAVLDHAADVNVQDRLGMTPLMQAARSGNANIISLLLERAALINTADVNGKTALQFAQELKDEYEKVEATRVLRAAGAA
jgi:ankyrin repeat protein